MNLQRVLEPEVMDSFEEAQDYDEMDHREVNRVFVLDLLDFGDACGDVLDVGTGTAQIPVALCQQQEDCRVMAIDLSINMLDLARYNIEIASLIDRIKLDHVDAKQLPYEDQSFDAVISNSIVHHIPEPQVALKEAVRVVKPGGILFFRDLMRPEQDADVTRFVQAYAAEENDHQRQMFEDSLRAALTLDEVRGLAESLGFETATVQATSDRHWTWAAKRI